MKENKPLTVRELHARLERAVQREPDAEVSVVRADPSMGPRARTGIREAGLGFDWDRGQFQLYPCEPVHRHNDEDQVAALRRELDGRVWEYHCLSAAVDRLFEAAAEYGRLHEWMARNAPMPEDYTVAKAKEAAERYGAASQNLKDVREIQKPKPQQTENTP